MNILFYGLDSSDELFSKYMSLNQNTYSVAHRLFEKAIVDELAKDKSIRITHKYIWQGKNERKIVKGYQNLGENIDASLLRFFNVPVLKFISIFINCLLSNIKWFFKQNKKEQMCIISSINYVPIAFGNLIFAKIFKVKNFVILTDTSISNAYTTNHLSLKSLIMRPYRRFVEFLEKKYDGYIFLTEYMNRQINKLHKPWCLVEGIFNPMELDFSPVEKKNFIMHAGTLNENLGIDKLIKAFKKVNYNGELRIFGSGNYVEKMKKDIKDDKRIKYCGFVSRDKIFTLEKEAILLINTRNPQEDFTKYSFPSKTMEYMASETPFMTTKLDCYPKEYDEHLIYIDDYSEESIKVAIEKFLSSDFDDRIKFGKEAKKFIFENKLQEKQVEKIKQLLRDNI